MKRLLLMRHAKSDWDAAYASDHDRPLSSRGERAAKVMGRVIAQSKLIPDLAVTSSAIRARTTVELAKQSGDWPTPIQVTRDLYGTSPRGALEVAATTESDIDVLMLVGHEPTWSALVHHLTGGSVRMKTGTVVGIDLAVDGWHRLPAVNGDIAFTLQPRLFTDGRWGFG